ncbi:hypothetical protein PS947_05512 [Pseudomonas fluorescens]|nr:hypothetical protein PS947_05512 [Pseudomonas fluorescens]
MSGNESPLGMYSALGSLCIDFASRSLANGYHRDHQYFILDPIHHPISGASQLNFVCITEAFESIRRYMWIKQPLR